MNAHSRDDAVTPPSETAPAEPTGSWWQFSLRTMLIAVTLVALVFGLWIVPAERQRQIVEDLQSRQVNVDYYRTKDEEENRSWIDDFLPLDYLRVPTGMNLLAMDCTAADLELCGKLPSLRALWFSSTTLRDDDLEPLTKLTSREELYIDAERLTPAGLATVARMKSLRSLRLRISPPAWRGMRQLAALPAIEEFDLDKMEDSGLEFLPEFPRLRTLRLYMTNVSGARIEAITRYPQLEMLDLSYTDIDDIGLAQLASLTSLTWLGLMDTKVTDDGLRHLARFSALECLALSGTEVTARGIERLAGLKNLRSLHLVNCRVSRDDVARLQKQFPACSIVSPLN